MVHDHRLLYDDAFWHKAYVEWNDIHPENWSGSVLYLGMGSCYNPLKQSDQVTKTTIVEIDQKTIDFNKDKIKPEWVIVCADVNEFEPEEKYDIIFADIWYTKVKAEVVDAIIEKYKNHLTENGQVIYLKTIKR